MLYPGETVRILQGMPEHGLPQYSEGRVAGMRRDEEDAFTAVEVEFYRDSRVLKVDVPLDAVEMVVSSSGLDRTAVMWAVPETPERVVECAMHAMLNHGFLMRDGLNVARLYYDRHERWWKWGDKHIDATGAHVVTAAPAWDGCVVAFSGPQRYHLEFRLQGRGEASVLLHERETAFAEQSQTAESAMSLTRVLMNLWEAIGARYCAFPVATPWLWDEDWQSLLRPPLYPDFFLLPQKDMLKSDSGSYRAINLVNDRAMMTVLPVKSAPHDVGFERSEHDLKLDHLRRCKALGEKYYDQLYETRLGTTGLYSNAKDAFNDAIFAANELGLKEEADELSKRLDHIKAVFRSQFS
ncbi:MAG: hypothetical protein WA738_05940 [Candidatus Angelobacter sp.]